jgi:cobalamin synthase
LSKDVGQAQRVGPLLVATFLVAAATAGAWWLGLPRAHWAAVAALVATALWALYLARRLGGQSGAPPRLRS